MIMIFYFQEKVAEFSSFVKSNLLDNYLMLKINCKSQSLWQIGKSVRFFIFLTFCLIVFFFIVSRSVKFDNFWFVQLATFVLSSGSDSLADITGRTALAVPPDVVNAKYHVITNATYNRDPVPAKFKHVTNIDTCTLLCCDYSTLWEALHVNMVEIGARLSDENVKILVSYQWIGWKRRTKMVGE